MRGPDSQSSNYCAVTNNRRGRARAIIFSAAVVIAILLSAAPARALEIDPPTRGELAALVTAQSMLLTDMFLTLDIKNHYGYSEYNTLILGPHPSDARVIGSFIGYEALLTVTWLLLPSGLRYVPPSLVIGFQTLNIAHNWSIGLRFST
jgi:hypothetical protein